jgi:hypothetical protein
MVKNLERVEEAWSSVNEEYLIGIMNECKNKADQHERAAYSYRTKHTCWGLPIVLLPTIMSPISLLVESNEHMSKYVNAIAFLTTGMIAGVYSFFKFGEKMNDHSNMSSRYADIKADIELELTKKREFRMQLDVFMSRIHMTKDYLTNTEPPLPGHILHDKRYKGRSCYLEVNVEEEEEEEEKKTSRDK